MRDILCFNLDLTSVVPRFIFSSSFAIENATFPFLAAIRAVMFHVSLHSLLFALEGATYHLVRRVFSWKWRHFVCCQVAHFIFVIVISPGIWDVSLFYSSVIVLKIRKFNFLCRDLAWGLRHFIFFVPVYHEKCDIYLS